MDRAIAERLRAASADPGVIPLAGGLPNPAQFPRRALAASFLRAVQAPAAPALQYGWPEGIAPLRQWVARRLRARGAVVDPEDVLITHGAQEGIGVAVQLATRPGSRVATDHATYPGALDLFRARKRVPVVAGEADGAEVAYVMPQVGNPLGQPLAAAERARLLASTAWVIEDDAYADLRFDGEPGRPLVADAPERVFHVGTLSKSLSPGLRVGWVVVPTPLRVAAREALQAQVLQAGSVAQAVAEDYLRGEEFEARLPRLRRFYGRRARRLARAVAAELPGWRFRPPLGGFALWVEADADLPEEELLDAAIASGVSFDPGSSFRPDGAAGPLALRLCFSFAEETSALEEGVRRLARCWRRLRSAGRGVPRA